MKIINSLPRKADRDEPVSLDIEMFNQNKDKLHRPHGDFACISVHFKGEEDVYQIYKTEQLPALYDALKEASWTFQNALYDLRQLRRFDSTGFLLTDRPIYDTMLVEQNLYGGYYRGFSLADLARRYLDIKMDKEVRGEFTESSVMTDEMKIYAATDAIITSRIREAQENSSRDLSSYWLTDAPMIWVLLDIKPVKVDVAGWNKLVEGFAETARTLEAELGFNVKSVPQTINRLAAEGIHVSSTGAKILEAFERKSDIVSKILQTRKYRDACSKYGVNWITKAVEAGDLVWADFKINGASTGRMSCSDPNLQNIPRKEFPEYRELFIPQYDYMLAPDVSQQEPRILGFLSQDKNLLEALHSGESIHVFVARMIYDDPQIVKDGKDIRYATGKAINLAISYGLTAKGLSEQTGTPEAESQKIIDKYFARFPGVKYYMQKYRNMAYKNGYVTTVTGRRIYVNPYDFKSENNAINSPIQGGAAEFTKLWMIKTRAHCKNSNIPFSFCMAVHDELVFDIQEEYKEQTIKVIGDAMQETAQILYPGIPFTSDMNIGSSWACHE